MSEELCNQINYFEGLTQHTMLDAAIEVAGKGYNNTATALFQYYVTNFGVLNEVGAAVPNDLSWIVAFELANSIFEKKLAANIAEKFGRC